MSPSLSPTCGPNGPDVNSVDDAILGATKEQIYRGKKFDTVDQLKQAIVLEWLALPQRFIDHSIGERIRRLQSEWQTHCTHVCSATCYIVLSVKSLLDMLGYFLEYITTIVANCQPASEVLRVQYNTILKYSTIQY